MRELRLEAPAAATTSAPPASGGDTLQAGDKAIDAPLPKVAALAEPALPEVASLPANEVKLPIARVDPAEIEARRKQLLAQQQARARAAKARRLAAARARAAAQARAAAASNPFGATSSTNTSTKSGG